MEQIQAEQQQLTMPRIGDPAPAFCSSNQPRKYQLERLQGEMGGFILSSF